MTEHRYPRIRVSGGPYERGYAYGEQARRQVHAARRGYERSFAGSGCSWTEATAIAERYRDPVRAHAPHLLLEMQGIADGADLPFEDILALNCRTEILWAALGRTVPECSAFGMTPERTENGSTWVGQNWDWLLHGAESIVLLCVQRDDGPDYITAVEAGLLAKTSINEHGFAVAVNTLVTTGDNAGEGVPFHVMLRSLVDCRQVSDAVGLVASTRRASAANYLVGAPGGALLDLETAPGGPAGLTVLAPQEGVLLHTNHFCSDPREVSDLAALAMPDSFVRLHRMEQLWRTQDVGTLADVDRALSDHVEFPNSICCHPDTRGPDHQQWTTVLSVVMDLEHRTLHLTEGNPCEAQRTTVGFTELLAVDSEQA